MLEFFDRLGIKTGEVVVTFLTGALTLVLALVVIYGWYTKNISLIQINPTFAPMQYNAAPGFVFCGLSFVFLNMTQSFQTPIRPKRRFD